MEESVLLATGQRNKSPMNPDGPRQLRSFATRSVFFCLLANVVPLGAQEVPPKATGVSTPGIQRSMTGLHALATFQVGGDPDWMALTGDSVWITSSNTNRVIRLDAVTNKVGESVTIPKPCSGLAIGFGSLWVPSCADHNLVRVDLKTQRSSPQFPLVQLTPRAELRQEREASGL